MKEQEIEKELINKLADLKYVYRSDINDRASLEKNFREKFEELNRIKLTDSEFDRLMERIITSDVYTASQTLRESDCGLHPSKLWQWLCLAHNRQRQNADLFQSLYITKR